MKKLTFVTGNLEKAAQLSRHLDFSVEQAKLDVPEIQSLDLEEVAKYKAQKAFEILGAPVLVEDTSLVFHSLGQLPGPLIKWFLESLGNDGMANLLDGYSDKCATAKVYFALCDESGLHFFKSSINGSIAKIPRGKKGFGWDSIFIPEGHDQTWGEMTMTQQDETSMRKKALSELGQYLNDNYR